MSLVDWAVLVLAVSWLGALAGAGVLFGMAYSLADGGEPTGPDLASPECCEGFERLRAAVASADIETEPGLPSADLIDCWSIWPDAPLAKDGRR
ncbi:hypothetical protein [Streptomyces cyaneofuscatus]|uniref:hypothetical protein n=1 Tax=Streptomyces cyaneofuscatus TaxID=66883 RepID=UPI0036DB13BE